TFRIDLNSAGAQHFGALGTAASENRFDSKDELTRAEGLHHVVVSAQFEADHAIDFLAPGGEHHDRDIRRCVVRPQCAAYLDAVDIWQHQIENYQIGGLLLNDLQRFATAVRVECFEA